MKEPRIEIIQAKKLVGIHLSMSFADNKTKELWESFMPHRNKIRNRVDTNYYSMQLYEGIPDFANINPHAEFTKWAAVEVDSFEEVPAGMGTYELEGGRYAVFIHKGLASAFMPTVQFIYGEWLPNSGYVLDDREHFELLTENYSPTDPSAEEEVWIPIK